jgi:hypothetical protein
MPDDHDEAAVHRKKEDVVIDSPGSFCIEIILAESAIRLPELSERVNPRVFVKNWKPAIMSRRLSWPAMSCRFIDIRLPQGGSTVGIFSSITQERSSNDGHAAYGKNNLGASATGRRLMD